MSICLIPLLRLHNPYTPSFFDLIYISSTTELLNIYYIPFCDFIIYIPTCLYLISYWYSIIPVTEYTDLSFYKYICIFSSCTIPINTNLIST